MMTGEFQDEQVFLCLSDKNTTHWKDVASGIHVPEQTQDKYFNCEEKLAEGCHVQDCYCYQLARGIAHTLKLSMPDMHPNCLRILETSNWKDVLPLLCNSNGR